VTLTVYNIYNFELIRQKDKHSHSLNGCKMCVHSQTPGGTCPMHGDATGYEHWNHQKVDQFVPALDGLVAKAVQLFISTPGPPEGASCSPCRSHKQNLCIRTAFSECLPILYTVDRVSRTCQLIFLLYRSNTNRFQCNWYAYPGRDT